MVGEGGGGSVLLKTALPSTKAGESVRYHRHMSDLAGKTMVTSVQLSPDNQSAANAGAQCDIQKILGIVGGNVFPQSGAVGVVFQHYGQGGAVTQRIAQRRIFQRMIGCANRIVIRQKTGDAHANSPNIGILFAGIGNDLSQGLQKLSFFKGSRSLLGFYDGGIGVGGGVLDIGIANAVWKGKNE